MIVGVIGFGVVVVVGSVVVILLVVWGLFVFVVVVGYFVGCEFDKFDIKYKFIEWF